MLECFLLLGKFSSAGPPLIAILSVLAGSAAAICLMLSGIKGIITEWCRPKRRVVDPASQSELSSGLIQAANRAAKAGGQR